MCAGFILLCGTPNLMLSVGLSRAIIWICKFIVTLSVVLLLSRMVNSLAEVMISRAKNRIKARRSTYSSALRRVGQVSAWECWGNLPPPKLWC